MLRALFVEVRHANSKGGLNKGPRAPSCVIRQSNMPLSTAALTVPDRERDLEAGSSKLSRRSMDSLADLERPVARSSFELRQHEIDANRTAVHEAMVQQKQRRQERGDQGWPCAII